MGIVLKQSFRNTLIIYLAFLIGGINTIVFYPRFLGSEFYGLVTFLLSSTNCLLLCGTLYGLDEYNKNLKNINNKLPNLSMAETKE